METVLNDLMQDSISDSAAVSVRHKTNFSTFSWCSRLTQKFAMTFQQDSSLGTCVCTGIWRSGGPGRKQNRKRTLHVQLPLQGTISCSLRPPNLRAGKLHRPSSTFINHWKLDEDRIIIARRGVSSYCLLHNCFLVQQR